LKGKETRKMTTTELEKMIETTAVDQNEIGTKELGHLINMKIQGEIPRIELEERQKAAGLEPLPRRKQKKTALYQALKELAGKNTLLAYVGMDGEWAVYRLVDQFIDKIANEVDFSKRNRIRFNTVTDTIIFELPESIEQEVKNRLAHYLGTYTADDIYDVSQRYIESKFAGIRIGRGLFFVPESFSAQTLALKSFVDAIPNSKLLRIAVVNDQENQKSMYNAFIEQLTEEYDTLRENIKELATRDGHIRVKNFNDNFQSFRQRVDIYSTAMNRDSRVLEQKINQLEAEFKQALAGR